MTTVDVALVSNCVSNSTERTLSDMKYIRRPLLDESA